MPHPAAVFTDLDGTLLASRSQVSPADRGTLRWLGDQGVLRVAATGRNLRSARKVIDDGFPIDYLAFSTGAGIARWPSRELVFESHLPDGSARRLALVLMGLGIDFMVHHRLPDSHPFAFHRAAPGNGDFEHRLALYAEFAEPLIPDLANLPLASQFVCVLPHWRPELERQLSLGFPELELIRATSPLDHLSVWLELFPKGISKGSALLWLCQREGIDPRRAMSVGNDYNDLAMLERCGDLAFVVRNAPEPLRARFRTCPDNDSSGFSQAVRLAFGR